MTPEQHTTAGAVEPCTSEPGAIAAAELARRAAAGAPSVQLALATDDERASGQLALPTTTEEHTR